MNISNSELRKAVNPQFTVPNASSLVCNAHIRVGATHSAYSYSTTGVSIPEFLTHTGFAKMSLERSSLHHRHSTYQRGRDTSKEMTWLWGEVIPVAHGSISGQFLFSNNEPIQGFGKTQHSRAALLQAMLSIENVVS
jgi:hypothetical protein